MDISEKKTVGFHRRVLEEFLRREREGLPPILDLENEMRQRDAAETRKGSDRAADRKS